MMGSATAAGIVFEHAGSGEPVVMVHGLGGTSNTFQPLMSLLSNYSVFRPDLPGSGRSPVIDRFPTITSFAEIVKAGLAELGVTRAHFVGHSMGTLVCQHLAVHAPELVKSMVLFGALTEPGEASRKGLIDRAKIARSGNMDIIAEQIIANTLAPCTHTNKPEAVAFVRESIMRQDPEGYAQACGALSKAEAYPYHHIRVSTLVIAGDCDPVAPQSMGQVLRDKIPRATITVLDRCGHWITIEKAQESSRKLADFLLAHRD